MATRKAAWTPDDIARARAAVSVETLARARYGEPSKAHSTRKTLVWPHTEWGRLLVGRPGAGPWENAFQFEAGPKGKGPLDWLTRVQGLTFPGAEAHLLQHPAPSGAAPAAPASRPAPADAGLFRLPPSAETAWPAVAAYLTGTRGLSAPLVQALHAHGLVYGTAPGGVPYAVFPWRTADGGVVGAMLRCAGTPEQATRQEAKLRFASL